MAAVCPAIFNSFHIMEGEKMVKRIYIEKKKGFDVEAGRLLADLKSVLDLPGLTGVRIINRYDIEGIDEGSYNRVKHIVFADESVETTYDEELPDDLNPAFFAFEYLPGQYDQRADSAAQCIRMLNPLADVTVKYARVIALNGKAPESDITAIKGYCINPVDSREAGFTKPYSLKADAARAEKVEIIDNFINLTEEELFKFKRKSGFAMSDGDICFLQEYFKEKENRDPTITELRALDAYWSDHCRHTTFMTRLNDIKFADGADVIKEAFDEYIDIRKAVYGDADRDICLMDIACIGAKHIRKKGLLDDLDESDEVNACSIKIKADVDGKE